MAKEKLQDSPASVDTIDQLIALIQSWYASDFNGFATAYDKAVANVQTIPAGTDPSVIYDWKHANIDAFCQFFRDWSVWNPSLSTGLQYIQKFSWLYYKSDAGLDFVKSSGGYFVTKSFVEINGKKMDSPDSKALVKQWEEAIGDGMNDYIIPDGGFQNFNEFFAREIKPGMRPVSSPNDDAVVASPADAIVNMIDDNLTLDTQLDCKTQKLSVKELLDNSPFAKNFLGGTAVSCILMPTVYHRYHAPVSGSVVESRQDVAGQYFGIDDFPKLLNGGNVGYGYDYSVFEHFRRGYVIIKTQDYGHVAMIPVGLNTIASVIFNDPYKHVDATNPVVITKGDEVGYFQYGGSLNILLFEKGVFPSVRIPQGQMIGTMNKKAGATDDKIEFIF